MSFFGREIVKQGCSTRTAAGTMGDSGYSASELRQRYSRGGSAPDSELSAAQLRSRYGMPSNKDNFSTDGKDKQGGGPPVALIAVGVLAVGALVVFFVMNQ